jgi:hypothetical protein
MIEASAAVGKVRLRGFLKTQPIAGRRLAVGIAAVFQGPDLL